jgi:nucleotide-binding universal stress UspA family protein
MKFILCAVDRSTQPLEALRYAARLSATVSARLVLLHVDSPPHGGVLTASHAADDPPDEDRWTSAVAAITGRKPEVHFATGDAGEEIVRFARKWRCDPLERRRVAARRLRGGEKRELARCRLPRGPRDIAAPILR